MYIPITNIPADVVVIANIKNKKHVKYYQGRNSKEKKLNKGDQWKWFEVVILGKMDWEDLAKVIFLVKTQRR